VIRVLDLIISLLVQRPLKPPPSKPAMDAATDYIDCTYDHPTAQAISILLPSVAHELHWNWNKNKWTGKFKIPPSIFKDQIYCQAQVYTPGFQFDSILISDIVPC
jgi:hypothetical protein